mgnify:CR=1 FL=1
MPQVRLGLRENAPQFTLLKGDDALTDYQFNKHIIHHNFCSVCGVGSFAHGKRPGRQDRRQADEQKASHSPPHFPMQNSRKMTSSDRAA